MGLIPIRQRQNIAEFEALPNAWSIFDTIFVEIRQ